MTPEQQKLIDEVTANMQKNRALIVAALETCKSGEYLHVFPKYNMGIRIAEDGTITITSVALATITGMKDSRVFRNKAGNSTVVQHRRYALEAALESMDRSIEQMPKILEGVKL